MKTLIEPTVDAVTESMYIPDDRYFSLAQNGLTGGEEITVNIRIGATSVPVVPKVAVSVAENLIQLAGPNTYEIIKPVTASPTGVYYVQ